MGWSLPTSILTFIIYRTLVANCNDIFITTCRRYTERRGFPPHLARLDRHTVMYEAVEWPGQFRHQSVGVTNVLACTDSLLSLDLKRAHTGWGSSPAYSQRSEQNTVRTLWKAVIDWGSSRRGRHRAVGIERGWKTGGICNVGKKRMTW